MKIVGPELKKACLASSLLKYQIAEKAQIDKDTLHRIEIGKNNPRFITVLRLTRFLPHFKETILKLIQDPDFYRGDEKKVA